MEKRRGKKTKENVDSCSWWLLHKERVVTFICISVFALLIRVMVSMYPYSGAGDPPKYGDFEAQRHWMEITLNTPVKEWYRNTTSNNLTYWGLDYPPLTAYQSYAHSLFLYFFHPSSVALFTSRGHESPFGKLLMRWTVLTSDVLIFFPAAILFVMAFYANGGSQSRDAMSWNLVMILMNPCLILIDHGHFQYNCISLGLTIGAVAAILFKNELVGCLLFSLALNHKQMSLYLAPAFFSHLLGKCLRHRNPFLRVLKLGLMVLGTFIVIWWPYLYSLNSVTEVLSRLAPFERGIYEDYVANFWCTSSILIKWKILFTTQFLKLLSLSLTMLTLLPSMIQQIRTPSDKGFLYTLLNSAFSFYFFSFQVHEKSVLLPLLPASLLALEEPRLYKWFTYFALLSMFPLLCRDKLIVPYIALHILFVLVFHSPYVKRGERKEDKLNGLEVVAMAVVLLISLVLHVVYLTMKPPERYPYLFEAMIMTVCFSQFIYVAIYTNIKQCKIEGSTGKDNEKKVQ
ncbi:dolichyl-P-Glc:Man9GlcNAc2-PP-dolichol alpha-1,3-glucosyltransferase [Ranunculus cassubicifolius]